MRELKEITDSFYREVGVAGIQQYQIFLNAIAKGNLYRYNFNNQILIYKQQPDAEIVAGYHAWKQEGHIPRRHTAIYASTEDRMCTGPYLFSDKNILKLSEEEAKKLSWTLEEQDRKLINESFVDFKEDLQDTIKEASYQCFLNIEGDAFEEAFARELAACAAESIILQRCGFAYEWSQDVQKAFDQMLAEKDREEIVRKIQPYVSEFSSVILGNIGRLLANKRERIKEQNENIGRNQEGTRGGDKQGIRGTEERTRPGGDDGRRSEDSGTGRSESGGTGSGTTVEQEQEVQKIEDFGEKIGGARKDLWSARGLLLEDLLQMNEGEKKKYVNKNQVWPKPDYKQMKEDGVPVELIYFYKKVRDALPVEPGRNPEKYVSFVSKIRQETMKCRSDQDIRNLKNYIENESMTRVSPYRVCVKMDYLGLINNKLLKALADNRRSLAQEVSRKRFLYSEDEKVLADYQIERYDNSCEWSEQNGHIALSRKTGIGIYYMYPEGKLAGKENWKPETFFIKRNGQIFGNNFETREQAEQYILQNFRQIKEKKAERKKSWKSPILESVERQGLQDVCDGKMIEGQDFIDEFAIRGGEFGNWLSEKDKQTNLNMAYEAFCDIAEALDIDRKDVSLGGKLAIAFGARGKGSALAHYEPDLRVINLTKMKGAGSLGHEWGHALDFISREFLGEKPEERKQFSEVMKWKTEAGKKVPTDFFKNSQSFDAIYSKCDKGYWSSDEEMFARAFACYLEDRLEELGGKSDYLCGHADKDVTQTADGRIIRAYPEGEERRVINREMDVLVRAFKEKKFLHFPEETLTKNMEKSR